MKKKFSTFYKMHNEKNYALYRVLKKKLFYKKKNYSIRKKIKKAVL